MRHKPLANASEHAHDCWEIILTLDGNGHDIIDGYTSRFQSGSILVCPPGVQHGRLGVTLFKDIFVQFNGADMLSSLSSCHFMDNSAGFFRQMFIMLHSLYYDQTFSYSNAVDSLFESMCDLLVAWDGEKREDSCAYMLKNEIIKGFTDPDFEASDAMEKMNFSKDYIRKRFRENMGMTPVDYLTRLRIQHAQKLLDSSPHSPTAIAEIALRSGFYDPLYFCRIFKKIAGISPSAYRNRNA